MRLLRAAAIEGSTTRSDYGRQRMTHGGFVDSQVDPRQAVDLALIDELDKVKAMEAAGELESMEVVEANRLLGEAAAWQRGFRPPTNFEEAWERILERKAAGRLTGGWR